MSNVVYVQRDGGGSLCGVFANKQPSFAEEELPADSAEVVAYLAPTQKKRQVLKSVITARLITAGKVGDAMTALMADPSAFARWVAADHPSIDFDAPDATALLTQIGADPEVILAP